MTPGQTAVAGMVFGASAAAAFMGAYIIRTAVTITLGHRWPDFQRIR